MIGQEAPPMTAKDVEHALMELTEEHNRDQVQSLLRSLIKGQTEPVPKYSFVVDVEQLVADHELRFDDHRDGPPEGRYWYTATSENDALDQFHEEWAIKCLDHYEITVAKADANSADLLDNEVSRRD